MSFHDLKNIVGKAAKAIFDNEEFSVGILAAKARQAAEMYPTDTTLVAMSNFLNKRANSKISITRAELKDVYNKLYSTNNKFAGLFVKELGIDSAITKKATITRDPKEGTNLVESIYENYGDPVLANALSAVFDNEKTVISKLYSPVIAKNAAKTCLHELNRFVAPRKIDVVAGQEDIIICKATYQTPKGESFILVPVEIKQGMTLLPTMFLSQAGLVDLSETTIREHIIATAGKSFKIDAQKFLEVVASTKNGHTKSLSPIEMIIAKTAATKGTPLTHTIDGILYQQIDPAQIEIPLERTSESLEFGKNLSTPKGAAEMIFTKAVVDTGRTMIVQAMKNFGYKSANIAVADTDQNNMFFAVAVDNKIAFKVPVKVIRNNPQFPSFAIASGKMVDFTSQGISSLLVEDVDTKMMAVASPAYGLKSNELIEQVKVAMNDGNLLKAEDALTVLQQSGDVGAYNLAFNTYLNGLNKKDTVVTQCNQQRKVAHSKYLICGHTNLPVHKVYQDKHGQCAPLYRKDIPEAEGGSFLHSRVYLG